MAQSNEDVVQVVGRGRYDAVHVSSPPRTAPTRRVHRFSAVLMVLLLVGGCLALSWWMTGPAPKSVNRGTTGQAPPLVLPSNVGADDPMRRAADDLSRGRVVRARRQFSRRAAENQNDPMPQVGIALTRWNGMGAAAVVRDLEQLKREYPESRWVALHLGLARLLAGNQVAAMNDFRSTRNEARAAGEYEIARRADDLLHPTLAPGYPVPLVEARDDAPATVTRAVAGMRSAMVADDRRAAATAAAAALKQASSSTSSVDDVSTLRALAAAAMWDKDEPEAQLARIAAVMRASPGRADIALQHAVILLWNGKRTDGVASLRRVAVRTRGSARNRRASQQAQAVLNLVGSGRSAKPGTAAQTTDS